MTASVIILAHYRNQQMEKPHMLPNFTTQDTNSLIAHRLRCAEANLVELLVHCAMENLSPCEVESLITPPQRLALDYCIPEVVRILETTVTSSSVALSRNLWRKSVPRALFGRFVSECPDDDFFLIGQLEETYQDLSRALPARQ